MQEQKSEQEKYEQREKNNRKVGIPKQLLKLQYSTISTHKSLLKTNFLKLISKVLSR